MTVSIARRPLYSPRALSDATRLVVGMIDGGDPWLSWAIYDPVARYSFDDEAALLVAVQNNLHASPVALLPRLGLMVSPVKLMTVPPAELRVLAQEQASDPSRPLPEEVAQILLRHELKTAEELDLGTQWLRDAGISDEAPLFQSITLTERIALLALSADCGEGGNAASHFAREAAAFALAEARTPLEFTDYYRIYVDMASLVELGAPPPERAARASQAVSTLLPLLFGARDCPRVEGIVAPAEVAAAVDDWQMMGRRLGFSRITLGVQQVVAHSSFRHVPLDQAARAVEAYLAGAQSLLREGDLGPPRLAQDGASRSFRVPTETEVADVLQDAQGIISLGSYRALQNESGSA
jgi:hypothetical protein